ncbi:MAG: hypothetical protein LUD02_01215 [Tannerellaceae bacterium]|nr:hypothetical protein [Tannerellaceae bacterium]MCD8262924.1 hypothetical protein [Tannerellaceae bacterium]
MYKEIVRWVFLLISQPAKAWQMLSEKEEDEDAFLTRFMYPLIGLVTAAAFLGILFTRKEFDVELALKASIRSLLSAFGGFYLGSYFMSELWHFFFGYPKDMKRAKYFVGYSSVLIFTVSIVLMLLPEFFFLRIFVLYTAYIVWKGAYYYLQIDEDTRLKFVGMATLVILATPWLIEKMLTVFMPGFSF